jgi:4-amino-4-deoxy-L-arabinose transferase-like glycosyltransferase
VDLTPANLRPYVGSSGSNSELALALGYNGVQRLLGQIFRIQSNVASGTSNVSGPFGPGGASENGAQGVFRLLNAQLGGQTSWLLALGIAGMLATGWGLRPRGFVRALPERVRAWRASAEARRAAHLPPQAAALVLWGLWTLTMAGFFSVAGFYHRYYLAMLAPGIAALAGIGLVLLWRDYRATQSSGRNGWLLPVALVATAVTQGVILADYANWNRWMTPLVVVGTLLAAAALIWLRVVAVRAENMQLDTPIPADLLALPQYDEDAGALVVESLLEEAPTRPAPRGVLARAWRSWAVAPLLAVTLGVAVLLVGPATWAGVSLANGGGATLPAAGPSVGLGGGGTAAIAGRARIFARGFPSTPPNGFSGPRAGLLPSGSFPVDDGAPGGGGASAQVDRALVSYLEARQGGAKYLFATVNSMTAAPYIIQTGKSVIALGGFSGSDRVLTLSQLWQLIRSGQLKYFLLSGGGAGGPVGSGNSQIIAWITSHGTTVSASEYGGGAAGGTLYLVTPGEAGA